MVPTCPKWFAHGITITWGPHRHLQASRGRPNLKLNCWAAEARAIQNRWGHPGELEQVGARTATNHDCPNWDFKKLSHLFHEHQTCLVGGWATPLKDMKVSWDDDIPNIWENKKCQPNHQPVVQDLRCECFWNWGGLVADQMVKKVCLRRGPPHRSCQPRTHRPAGLYPRIFFDSIYDHPKMDKNGASLNDYLGKYGRVYDHFLKLITHMLKLQQWFEPSHDT